VEITTQQVGDALEIRLSGRLDAYWADHVARALDEAVRAGADRLRINMADVAYMSSVGIRVLLRFYKQLDRIAGSLIVVEPSPAVKAVLDLAGLQLLLAAATAAPSSAALAPPTRVESEGAVFDVFEARAGAALACRVVGQPESLRTGALRAEECRTLAFPATVMGLGLGAFGSDFTDCRVRFGEFLAAGGAAASLPTDGTNVPDYLVATGALVPQLTVLYALVCEGDFAQLARFEAPADKRAVELAALARGALDMTGAAAAAMVLVAESAGLMGVTLQRSPAMGGDGPDPLAYPNIRDWLSFTPERTHARGTVLIVGVVARDADPVLSPLLRPLAAGADLAGHFHAAAFSYRPLQKGFIDMQTTVAALFEGETLQGVLHLLNDDRHISGAGQSELVRGACWVSPIATISAEH
jgi:anti-anti-sigma factor